MYRSFKPQCSSWLARVAAVGAALFIAVANGTPIADRVAFDAAYTPALSATSSAAQDARNAERAARTTNALAGTWPDLRSRLLLTWGSNTPADWRSTLDTISRRVSSGTDLVKRRQWKEAHEALESIRIELRSARLQRGLEYFPDRLTAFHEPMEVLAMAGSTLRPEQLDATKRSELQRAAEEAQRLWSLIERAPIDSTAYGLTAGRFDQLKGALAAASIALRRLERVLNDNNPVELLAAAAAIKPPFARAYTAFGASEEPHTLNAHDRSSRRAAP